MRGIFGVMLWAVAVWCSSVSGAEAATAVAFVAEASGQGGIERRDGSKESLSAGAQLFDGDTAVAGDGAVLVFLSGRTLTLKAGQRHKVAGGGAQTSALVSRIADTLTEIAGPQSELDRPAVHGMARGGAELRGARPGNTRVLGGLFAFEWDPLKDAEAYLFSLETASGEKVERMVRGTQVVVHLQPGQRYHWRVAETGDFLPRGSGRLWVQVATAEEAAVLRQNLDQLAREYAGDTLKLMRLATLLGEGYYHEVAHALQPKVAAGSLAPVEKRLLHAALAKMEQLPGPAGD